MPQEGAFVVTVYAPIMFPPAPLLLFAQDKHTSKGGSSNWVVRSCSKAVRHCHIFNYRLNEGVVAIFCLA